VSVIVVLPESTDLPIGTHPSISALPLPWTGSELRLTLQNAVLREEVRQWANSAEERFFRSSIDLLCIANFRGHFQRLSPSWEAVLGFSHEELMACPMIEFVHPDDRERTRAQNGAVRTGGQALAFENRYRCRDGSYRWLLWNATADLEHELIYSVARDVTDRKVAEEERERLVRELQAALAEVKTLRAILPICSYCNRIRRDDNYWQRVDVYISQHTNTQFSHGICPTCYRDEVQPQLDELDP
jgi:PAS domain S-box-containing protein